jgi:heparanase 1
MRNLHTATGIALAALAGLAWSGWACAGASNDPPSETVVAPPPIDAVAVRLQTATALARVDPRYLSFAVDSSQVAGGMWWSEDTSVSGSTGSTKVPPFDFTRPRLRALASALAPAFLRIGGSEADRVFYDLSEAPVATAPPPYELVITRPIWDGLAGFARDLDLTLFFTLNAGPGPRDADKRWEPANARELVRYATGRGDPVEIWELGNEINGYPLFHGMDLLLDGAAYAKDLRTAHALLDAEAPGARLAGPSSAYWPVAGEMNPVMADTLREGGDALDVVTWHYYPQQSQRCPVTSRPAEPQVMLDPEALDEVDVWAAEVEGHRDAHAPGTPVWLGETGNAQCGGEPGVSDRWAGTFWWVDQLGRMARRGQPVVVRQTLSGTDYGLLDDSTLTPRPDYWASVLWKRLMGPTVLDATSVSPALRAYAHCAVPGEGVPPGAVAMALVNLADAATPVALPDGGHLLEAWVMTAQSLEARDVRLGDAVLAAAADGSLPELGPSRLDFAAGRWLELPPRSVTFLRLPDVDAPACR